MDSAVAVRSVVIAAILVAALPTGALAAPRQVTSDRAMGLPTNVDPDSVLLSVDIQKDGDARWLVEYRIRLSNENETEAFRSLQSDIESNESAYIRDFASGIHDTVRNAENATGRNMSAQNFTVETTLRESIGQRYGIVSYRFTWKNFAVVSGDRIRAGDALSGFFLDAETTMIFSYPESYGVVEVQPTPSERRETAVVWHGRLDFTDGEPTLVVAPGADGTTTPTTGTTPGPTGDGLGLLGPLVVGGLLILLIAAGGYVYFRREGGLGPIPGGHGGGSGGRGASSTPESGEGREPAASAESGGEAGAIGETGAGEEAATGAAGGAAGAAGREGTPAETEPEPPEELLSNEERVERFLREQGGRAKQQEVVDAMGWTEAKTSQVVKKMRESDDLESFRIGRENVLKLPGEGDGLADSGDDGSGDTGNADDENADAGNADDERADEGDGGAF